GFAIRRIPPEEIGETLALYERPIGLGARGHLLLPDPPTAGRARRSARARAPSSVWRAPGSPERAVARFGLRAGLPPGLDLIMGPGCPVCVTDCPEIDEAVALARAGLPIGSYRAMRRV